MACTKKSNFLCITLVLVLLGTSSPKADALIIKGLDILGIVLVGVAKCSPTVTSPCNTCAVIPNLRVSIMLNAKEIASGDTTSDGSIRIIINLSSILGGPLDDISLLKVFVSLPILGCPIWANVTTGHLEGTPVLNSVDGILKIANLGIPALTRVGA